MSLRTLAVILVAIVCVRVARADDGAYVPPPFLASPPALPAGYDPATAWRLDLSEALRIATQHNLNLTLARQQRAIARVAVDLATGAMYEPTVTAGVNHQSSEQPPSSLQAGDAGSIITMRSDTWQLGLAQRLPTGALVSLGFATGGTRSTAGTAVLPVTDTGSLTLTVSQPLLKGFSFDLSIPQSAILSARIASRQEREQLKIKAADVVQSTEAAYWDAVAALYSYDATIRSQRLAEDQIALVRRKIASGLAATSDLTAAESQLAQRKLDVVHAADSVEQAWDALRIVLDLPRDRWKIPILPTERPRFQPAASSTPEQALALAIAHRPELAQAALDIESSDLAMRKAANDRLPEIDLGLSASAWGQGASYGAALEQVGSRDATGWGMMMSLTWTPLGKAAAANAEIARIQHASKITSREVAAQTIWNQVRAAVRNQRTAAAAVAAASHARELAGESLEIENRKYLSGSSSNIAIAGAQKDLAGAELAELRALLDHQKAETALLLATGRLLDERHIVLE
jgi:outer membrane protein TolC